MSDHTRAFPASVCQKCGGRLLTEVCHRVSCRTPWPRVGDRVDYHAIIDGPVTERNLVVRAGPELLDHLTWVVWLEGKSGCVSVDALSRADHGRKEPTP